MKKLFTRRLWTLPAGFFGIIMGIGLLFASSLAFAFGGAERESRTPEIKPAVMTEGAETAVFAGGCFWGVEGVFERLAGVEDVVSGYSGGDAGTARYEMVGTGTTGHAESVRIIYDPKRISYRSLLEVFFTVAHNPTELNFQGPDVGTEYRSAVFYSNESQKLTTEAYIKELEAEAAFGKPIVTEVTPLTAFYPAEEYHQNFLRLNPTHPYIAYWDMPKIRELERKYPKMLADK